MTQVVTVVGLVKLFHVAVCVKGMDDNEGEW